MNSLELINMSFEDLQSNIYKWAEDKELLETKNSLAQFAKVNEEIGEVANALLKGNREELKDGIGDSIVTLIILASQNDMTALDCLNAAWKQIAKRTGQTVDGIFIKDE